jgi:phosphoribosylformimino-5-aminoimidazole carboxamide ribonucleotide (ProFAR) isomerase
VAGREDIVRLAKLARVRPRLDGAIVGKALYEGRATIRDLLSAAREAA